MGMRAERNKDGLRKCREYWYQKRLSSFYRLASFLTDGIIIVSFIKLSTEQNVALMSG